MKEEDISSQNTTNNNNSNSNNKDQVMHGRSSSPPQTPAASSVGASSPAVPVNLGSVEWPGNGEGSSRHSCRPWDRGDLLRRLATFKPTNLFGKSKATSPLTCAQRGWVNVDADKIVCESCGASLHYSSPASLTLVEADSTAEEFAKQLDGEHKSSCPWRGNSCPESLVQFPPTPASALIGGYKDRWDGLLQFYSLPVVSASTIEQMQVSRGPQIDRFLAQSQVYASGELGYKMENLSGMEPREDAFNIYSRAQKLISLCGWEPRWLPNVQDCEEHSVQSARDGCSSGPTKDHAHLQDAGLSRKAFSASSKKVTGNEEVLGPEFKCESRSPLLDCSLCGVTIRIWDFSTVSRPARLVPSNIDLPETSKKMGLTRGVSAASGINGWVSTDGGEKEQNEDHDEAATTDRRLPISNAVVGLNLTMTGGSSFAQLNITVNQAADIGRDSVVGQPSGSEVGDRAASYESRGPRTRKRSLDEGGSTVDRPHLRMQQADSVEGTVVDRDGDEVNDCKEYSAGPSKRARDGDDRGIYGPLHRRDSSAAGPSHLPDIEMDREINRSEPFNQGHVQVTGIPSTRDSTLVSSVIAMDTVCHSADDDSMESVENYPGDVDEINFPSVATIQSPDLNDPSEPNCSNQAQQSTCFQPVAVRVGGETGLSSTNDGEEVLNTETVTAHGRDVLSFGISGGSVGMGASHEAEIHGTDISVHRGDSIIGDMEPVAEIIENQGQTGEFAPDNGVTDDFVPEEMDREDPHGDSQDVVSRSVGRADSGSKIVGSVKAESVESGQKTSNMHMLVHENSAHPSLSCNAVVCSGYEASKEEVTQAGKASPRADCMYPESDYLVANGIGPPNGESNYEEAVEFDPIKHHNCFCPWVNGTVAAAGCSNSNSGSSAVAAALCGWQLTLDALDTFQSLGHVQIQTVESESAASLCKDSHQTPHRKLLAHHSFIKKRGQN